MINMKEIPDWSAYTDPYTKAKTTAGNPTTTANPSWMSPQPTLTWSNPNAAETTPGLSTFNYPSQWGQAGDYYTGMMNANYAMPQAWTDMYGMSKQMAQTGNPVDYTGWWNAQQPMLQNQLKNIYDMVSQGAAQANPGVASTGTPWAITNLGTQALQNLFGQYAGLATQGMENAANRQLQGLSQMYGLGAGEAGLSENALNRGMEAAGGLTGLGSLYANLPLSVASSMGGLGQSLTNQQIDPWTMAAMGLFGQPGQSSQRQPTTATNFFGSLLAGLPYLLNSYGGGTTGGWGGGWA
jgi:hypothetical protein